MDVTVLTAAALLKIPVDQPEKLYTPDMDAMKLEYRKLASHWHPDKGGNADVFAHIKLLFEKAEVKIMKGVWEIPGYFSFTDASGIKREIRYAKKNLFELGEYYICPGSVVYAITKDNQDLADIAVRAITGLYYHNADMEKNVGSYLPLKVQRFETADRIIVRIEKRKNSICLRDLLAHQGGKLDPKHVAWITSRLYNIACYLQISGLTHNDIAIDSLYIEPSEHTVSLIGGWWYSRKVGEKLVAAASNTVKSIPSDILSKKIADPRIDLDLIRSVGRVLLGDSIGNKLILDKSLPNALVTWYRSASHGEAIKDYRVWQEKVLIDSFGVRKFVPFDVSFNDVYPK